MTETDKAHANMVQALAKPGQLVLRDLTSQSADLLHAAVGISGEAGEFLDSAKKIAIYAKPLTPELRENFVEELGDLEFYLQQARSNLGITREETLLHNLQKLGKRYAAGQYSNQQAQDRADKQLD